MYKSFNTVLGGREGARYLESEKISWKEPGGIRGRSEISWKGPGESEISWKEGEISWKGPGEGEISWKAPGQRGKPPGGNG